MTVPGREAGQHAARTSGRKRRSRQGKSHGGDTDGKRVPSCLTLAAPCEGREVVTVESLAGNGTRHPAQEAFIRHDAFSAAAALLIT
jgi:aerobic-type carbon monoxide dehydrogenase small subunit (CoxS/CutS family)